MSGGMPELGSKISLISKADIRYEGRLYTVDPQECTIALSSVRSFGTEDRDTQFQIAPQSQIYDYILFRGSDIKDIRVINNVPHPNDPAIMQVQLQNGQQLMPHFPMPNMNTTAPQMATGSYPFGGMGGGLGAIGGGAGNSSAVGSAIATGGSGGSAPFLMGNQQQQQSQQQQQQQQQQKPQQPQHKQPNEKLKQPNQINQQEPQLPLAVAQPTEDSKKKMPDHAAANTTKLGNSGSSDISAIGSGGGTGSVGLTSDINALGNISTINPSSSSASASKKNLLSNAVALCEQKNQVSVLDMLAGGSRSTTPISLISRKSPSAEIGVQVNQQHQQQQQPQQQQQQHHNQMQHHSNQNNAGHGPNGGGNKRQNHHQQQQHQHQQQQQQQSQQRSGNNQQRNNNNDFYHQQRSGGRIQNNNSQQPHHEMRNNYNNQRNNNQGGSMGGPNRNWNMHRGVPNNIMMRNRGGGRGRMQNQGFRQMGVPGGVNQNKPRILKSTIKFEQDFDFEQANNKFEELRSQLAKLKVAEEPKAEQINGETDKKDDSGNETGAGEHEHEDDEITVGYDKTKSFFDNISCETAQDRSKTKKNDWRQERRLNSETFGVSSTRRGSYRGRINYYNRSIGNFNGGGNRGYHRTGMNYRNRNNNNNRSNMGGSGASRDNNNGDANFETQNNNATNTNISKNQPPQQQTTGSSGATAGGSNNATGANPSKSTPQQANNTINQPQVAVVGE